MQINAHCPFFNISITIPGIERIAFVFFQCNYSMIQSDCYCGLKSNWVLLDSQSNCDMFCNPQLLRNILPTDDTAEVFLVSNGGDLITNQAGEIPNYGQVFFLFLMLDKKI